ncbi:putative ABC transport system permease protein [Comamonas sp. BIGb0152]|uniref:ABC transporter permease n=1 Tax=Comamonas sp. BIGb0152 TaxID=2940601 RepID=UPI002169F697|nr:FtsX-like permease family protein [Comamonas sp. BIGb0152]MCS4295269.1 putative ABC transport system permease protein [Comamonas sp. BIGb0152]
MEHNFFALGWRQLLRDWRAGELRLLLVAVALAVAALTSVSFFSDRLQAGLQRDASQLLGGDVVVVSDNSTPAGFGDKAQALGLKGVTTVTFPTMARADDADGGESRLVGLKAVQAGYPLRGSLRTAPAAGQPDAATRDIPAPGEVWVDPSLLEALGLQTGSVLWLGDKRFTIGRVLTIEPDRGAGFLGFSPRVMLDWSDLAATGLVQPASRLLYRFAVAGEPAGAAQFLQWAEAEVAQPQSHGVRIESLQSGRPEMEQTLERAQKFLNLVALLAALLSAVAVALAARTFASAHLNGAALLRVLGLAQRAIAGAYVVEFVIVGLAASLLGVALGYAMHYLFVWLMAGLLAVTLPAASGWPLVMGVGMGMTLLLAFGLPPVLQLAQVPPLRVLRRDLGALRPASASVLLLGVLGFAAMLLLVSGDAKLGGIAVGGFAVAIVVFALLSAAAITLLRRVVNERTAPRWLLLATRQVAARPWFAVVQVSSLAVGLMALVLLVLLRTDLIQTWRQTTPPDAMNRFVINIQPDQAEAFQQRLRQAGIDKWDWYPMIRGRLIQINGKDVGPGDYTEDRAKRLVDREFNISHSDVLQEHNQIVQGQWKPGEAGGVSVEEGIAETLGLKMGDRLLFDMGGVPHESTITSLRKVDWGSMRANFFVMYPVAQMDGVAITYLAAYRAPETAGFDNALVREFPNITNVDLRATVAQLQQVLNQVIRAVEFLFGFTLAAGLVVLFAAITATREERAREYAIMRAVGARSQLLRQVQRAELAGVGLLAGVLASVVAMAIGWALAQFVFDFAWVPRWWVPLAGGVCGAILALVAGWWGLREVLRRPVVVTLREAV